MSQFDERKPKNLRILIPQQFDDILNDLEYNYIEVLKKSPTKWVGLCQSEKVIIISVTFLDCLPE